MAPSSTQRQRTLPAASATTSTKLFPGKRQQRLRLHLLSVVVAAFAAAGLISLVECSPPPNPIQCFGGGETGTTNCTITNYCATFPDRSTCHVCEVVYPSSEAELVAAVAEAVRAGRKIRVATRHSHSLQKLACPGNGDGKGVLISTRYLDHVVAIDAAAMTLTAESGVLLPDLLAAAAEAGLAVPQSPMWWGLTIGGLLSTGAHGSSLWGAGGAVHEYVVGMRIVSPASPEEGYAKVRALDLSSPELMDAAKVSLGVLGVISQVTLKLQPMFKRSVTNDLRDDSDLADRVVPFAKNHEFGSITWFPGDHRAVYTIDDRVPLDTPGNGKLETFAFRSTPTQVVVSNRTTEEVKEHVGVAAAKCMTTQGLNSSVYTAGFGFSNDGVRFTGYPVVGYHNQIQSSGGCLNSPEDGLQTACIWDPRINGVLFLHTSVTVALSQAPSFIRDIQRLRATVDDPAALCVLDPYGGMLLRFIGKSSAYLGKTEDSVNFEFMYYRSRDPTVPRLEEDVLEEIEQMALFKYGGLPHWGKNRNIAFEGVIAKYPKAKEFLRVKRMFDPKGFFSNEWTKHVLEIGSGTTIVRDGCALEGLCLCSEDVHCAPDKGYFCRPGKVYKQARVCTRVSNH